MNPQYRSFSNLGLRHRSFKGISSPFKLTTDICGRSISDPVIPANEGYAAKGHAAAKCPTPKIKLAAIKEVPVARSTKETGWHLGSVSETVRADERRMEQARVSATLR